MKTLLFVMAVVIIILFTFIIFLIKLLLKKKKNRYIYIPKIINKFIQKENLMELNFNNEDYKKYFNEKEAERITKINKEYEDKIAAINKEFTERKEREQKEYDSKLEDTKKRNLQMVQDLSQGTSIIDAGMYIAFSALAGLKNIADKYINSVQQGGIIKNTEIEYQGKIREFNKAMNLQKDTLTSLKNKYMDAQRAAEEYGKKAEQCHGFGERKEKQNFTKEADKYRKRANETLIELKKRGYNDVSDLDRKLKAADNLIQKSKMVLQFEHSSGQFEKELLQHTHDTIIEYHRTIAGAERQLNANINRYNEVDNLQSRYEDVKNMLHTLKENLDKCPQVLKPDMERQIKELEKEKENILNQTAQRLHIARESFVESEFVNKVKESMTKLKTDLTEANKKLKEETNTLEKYIIEYKIVVPMEKVEKIENEIRVELTKDEKSIYEGNIKELGNQEKEHRQYAADLNCYLEKQITNIESAEKQLKEEIKDKHTPKTEKEICKAQLKACEEVLTKVKERTQSIVRESKCATQNKEEKEKTQTHYTENETYQAKKEERNQSQGQSEGREV